MISHLRNSNLSHKWDIVSQLENSNNKNKTKNLTISNIGKDMEQLEFLYVADRNVNDATILEYCLEVFNL